MKPGIARIGDLTRGECKEHGPQTGRIITGSNSVLSENGRGIAGIGDLVLAECGHTGIIVTGDYSISINQKGVARIGSRVDVKKVDENEVDENEVDENEVVKHKYTGRVITGSRDIS